MSGKRWIFAAAALMAASSGLSCRADGYTGEKTLGINVGYNTYNREPLAGAQFSYRFNRLLRISPAVDYVFRRDGHDALIFNLNMDFVFPLSNGRCGVFPLVGVNYSSWNYHPAANSTATDDVSTRISRMGLNAGAGFDVNISGSLRLSLIASYTLIKEFGGTNIAAGIHYRF